MESYVLQDESDIQLMRDLIQRLPHQSTIVDFEETMLLASVRATTRLWEQNGKSVGFAFVDDYNNLRFEIETESDIAQLAEEIVEWGIACIKKRNATTGKDQTLDASFGANNSWQIAMLEKFGFVRESFRTLQYRRSLEKPIIAFALPQGHSLRCVAGEHEVDTLVSLHRAAFGTENMTAEQRLAIMNAPQYERELDLVTVASNGDLSAFCICGFEDEIGSEKIAYTDPVGTHPHYQKRGLAKAIVTAGLHLLRSRGASTVELNTSSNNRPMKRLAESLGFVCTSEKLWFSKEVT